MGGELELIWADRDDLPEVARLLEWRRTGAAEAPALTWSQLSPRYGAGLAALAGGGLQVLLARFGDAPVGYLTAAVIPKLDQRRGVLYVDELWVAPPHRNTGIARAMLSAAAAHGRQLGLWRLRLYGPSGEQAGAALYRRHFAEPGRDALLFQQCLEAPGMGCGPGPSGSACSSP